MTKWGQEQNAYIQSGDIVYEKRDCLTIDSLPFFQPSIIYQIHFLYNYLSFILHSITLHYTTHNQHIKMQFSTKLSVAAAFAAVANAALTVNSPVRISILYPLSSSLFYSLQILISRRLWSSVNPYLYLGLDRLLVDHTLFPLFQVVKPLLLPYVLCSTCHKRQADK